jgi:hypothetical protein
VASDWIDQTREERSRGYRRPLLPSQHDAVNARYPGLTYKHCPVCDVVIDDSQTCCSEECLKVLEGADYGE